MRRSGADALTIRPGEPRDLGALLAIEATVFPTARLSRRSLRRLLDRPSARLLVAEHAGRPVGYALVLLRRNSRVARLYSIGRAADAPVDGIGARLLEAAEIAARRAGADTMRLEVRPDNTNALRLYERSGYRAFARSAHYYEDGAGALRLQKKLDGDTACPAG